MTQENTFNPTDWDKAQGLNSKGNAVFVNDKTGVTVTARKMEKDILGYIDRKVSVRMEPHQKLNSTAKAKQKEHVTNIVWGDLMDKAGDMVEGVKEARRREKLKGPDIAVQIARTLEALRTLKSWTNTGEEVSPPGDKPVDPADAIDQAIESAKTGKAIATKDYKALKKIGKSLLRQKWHLGLTDLVLETGKHRAKENYTISKDALTQSIQEQQYSISKSRTVDEAIGTLYDRRASLVEQEQALSRMAKNDPAPPSASILDNVIDALTEPTGASGDLPHEPSLEDVNLDAHKSLSQYISDTLGLGDAIDATSDIISDVGKALGFGSAGVSGALTSNDRLSGIRSDAFRNEAAQRSKIRDQLNDEISKTGWHITNSEFTATMNAEKRDLLKDDATVDEAYNRVYDRWVENTFGKVDDNSEGTSTDVKSQPNEIPAQAGETPAQTAARQRFQDLINSMDNPYGVAEAPQAAQTEKLGKVIDGMAKLGMDDQTIDQSLQAAPIEDQGFLDSVTRGIGTVGDIIGELFGFRDAQGATPQDLQQTAHLLDYNTVRNRVMTSNAYSTKGDPQFNNAQAVTSHFFDRANPGKVTFDAAGRQNPVAQTAGRFDTPEGKPSQEAAAMRAQRTAAARARQFTATQTKGAEQKKGPSLVDKAVATDKAIDKAVAKQNDVDTAIAKKTVKAKEAVRRSIAKVAEKKGSIVADEEMDMGLLQSTPIQEGFQKGFTPRPDLLQDGGQSKAAFARSNTPSGMRALEGMLARQKAVQEAAIQAELAKGNPYERKGVAVKSAKTKEHPNGAFYVEDGTRSHYEANSGKAAQKSASVRGAMREFSKTAGPGMTGGWGFGGLTGKGMKAFEGLNAKEVSRLAAKNRASGGGSSDSSRVICTELVRQGLMSPRLQRLDVAFTVARLSPAHVRGYHAWAVPFVRLMRKHPISAAMIEPLARWRAEEVAYQLGDRDKPNWLGKFTRWIGEPICWVIGQFVGETETAGLYKTT